MEEHRVQRKSTALFVLTFATGGLLGAIAGLLFAPRSGRETRDRARSQMEEASRRVQESAEKLRSRAGEMISSSKESGLIAGPSCTEPEHAQAVDEQKNLLNA